MKLLTSFLKLFKRSSEKPVNRTKFVKSFDFDHLPRDKRAAAMREIMRTR